MNQATPVHAIQWLAAGSTVPAIIGTITKVYDDRKTGTSAHGEWSFQRAGFRGTDGNEITIKFCDMPLIGQDWKGVPVAFHQSDAAKAKSIVVDEYTAPATGVTTKSLKINATARVEWNPAGYQAAPAPQQQQGHPGPPPQQNAPQGPPQHAQGPPPQQHSAPPLQSPPPQRQSAPAQQQPPARTGNMPIHGATVGMAVKLAGDIILGWGPPSTYWQSRQFSVDLHEIASDIIRVSKVLEDGKLAASAARREQTQKLPARPDIVPDHSHDPPQNERERMQNQGPPPQPAFPSGSSLPQDTDDEIPF